MPSPLGPSALEWILSILDPNANLFPQGRTESAHGPEKGAMGSALLSRVAKSADA